MMEYLKFGKYGFAGLLVGLALVAQAFTVSAQVKAAVKPKAERSTDARDPFRKYEEPRVNVKKGGQVMPPSIQERIAQYKAQKVAAMNARIAAPKPTTALLLSELQIIGISRTPRGYAAIVQATPIKLSYVIYPGERFYDGQLVAIEDNRLVFRRETVFTDGRREHSVEIKPLRQLNSVEVMSSTETAPANVRVADSDKRPDDRPPGPVKP